MAEYSELLICIAYYRFRCYRKKKKESDQWVGLLVCKCREFCGFYEDRFC